MRASFAVFFKLRIWESAAVTCILNRLLISVDVMVVVIPYIETLSTVMIDRYHQPHVSDKDKRGCGGDNAMRLAKWVCRVFQQALLSGSVV